MLSKITFSLILLLFSSEMIFGQERTEKKFPAQMSLVYPVGTSGANSLHTSFNFSLNALAGATSGIKGCEIGGLLNYNENNVSGVQIGGIGNMTRGNFIGFRTGGIFGTSHTSRGLQINGIFTGTNEARGVLLSGIINLTKNSKVTIAGIANVNQDRVKGIQLAGIYNLSDKLNGVQIGLINVVDSIEKGVSIGLISYARHNYYRQWSVSFADYMNTGVNFRSGTKSLYNIYSVGLNYLADPLWVAGLGFGHISPLGKNFNFQPELTGYGYFPRDFRHIRSTYVLHLKIGFNFELNEHFSLTIAPDIYGALKSNEGKYEKAGYEQSPISPIVSHKNENSNSVLEAGIGLSLEFCIK